MFQDQEGQNIGVHETSTGLYITKERIIKAANPLKKRKAVWENIIRHTHNIKRLAGIGVFTTPRNVKNTGLST